MDKEDPEINNYQYDKDLQVNIYYFLYLPAIKIHKAH